MKTFLIATAILSIHSFGIANEFSYSNFEKYDEEWQRISHEIALPRFKFQDASWLKIFKFIETESKKSDPNKKGIEIYIPDQFKDRFDALEWKTWTINLHDNISLSSIFSECPPPPPFLYFPVSGRRFAVIPADAIPDLPKESIETVPQGGGFGFE